MIQTLIQVRCVACGSVYSTYPSGGLCHKCGNMSFRELATTERMQVKAAEMKVEEDSSSESPVEPKPQGDFRSGKKRR